MATKAKGCILEAVHDSASEQHWQGFIDKRKVQKYDRLLEPVQDYAATKVKALRERLYLRQAACVA